MRASWCHPSCPAQVRAVFAVLGASLIGCGASRPPTPPAPLAPNHWLAGAKEIVDTHRSLIVLGASNDLDVEALGFSSDEVSVLGQVLFDAQRERQAALVAGLRADPAALDRFLDWLERDAELWDADKLAFREVVAELARHATGALRARLDADAVALGEVRARYDAELQGALGRFNTRGIKLRREAWEVYLAEISQRQPLAEILARHAAILQAIAEPTRGRKQRRRKDGEVIAGFDLPDKTVVLTFDDGPHPQHTPAVLRILESFGIKSIFFQVGSRIANSAGEPTELAGLTREIQASAHLLGNHTYEHKLLPTLDAQGIGAQIDLGQGSLERVVETPVGLFRPPYGGRDAVVDEALRARGLRPFLWNVDSRDWADPIPRSIADRTLAQIEAAGRGVILMHDVHPQTVEALPLVIEGLIDRGFQFVLWDGTALQNLGESRGAGVAAASAKASPYRESWAVVIGINTYQHWPKLAYAVNDARAVREALTRRLGFPEKNIITLLDGAATREAILAALGDRLANPDEVKPEDRVFVFYAGHGITRKLPSGRELGFIVPVDADQKSYQSQAISMTAFQDLNEAIPAKHVLYVMDACYSGVALTRGGGAHRYVEEVTSRRARQMLTAGGADEQVADGGPGGHSIFTWTLLQALEGDADLNSDGFITGSELGTYVAPSVSALSRQTPAFGNLVGSAGGEFVFEVERAAELLSRDAPAEEPEAAGLRLELERVRGELAAERARAAALSERGAPAEESVDPAEEVRRLNDDGVRLFKAGKSAQALTAFLDAVKLAPEDLQSINNLGFLYQQLGDAEAALPWLEKVVALDPGRGVAHLNLGDVYLALGREADAVQSYKRYLGLVKPTKFTKELGVKVAALEKKLGIKP